MRTYIIGTASNGRHILKVSPAMEIPFNIFRDVGRLAGKSYNDGDAEVFEFLVAENLPRAEKILQGGLWNKQDG